MKASTILKTLSLRCRIRASLSASPAAVAPLPITTQFDDGQYVTNSVNFLLHALNASINAQEITLKSLASTSSTGIYQLDSDCKAMDEYLEDNIKMLGTCNELSDKMESIKKYMESLRVVSHLLDQGNYCEPSPSAIARAEMVLDSCEEIERSCSTGEMNKYCGGSGLGKFLSQKLCHQTNNQDDAESEFGKILSGSNAVASVVCGILGLALSSKSKRGSLMRSQSQSHSLSSWSCSLQQLQQLQKRFKIKNSVNTSFMTLNELHRTVTAAWDLRDRLKCKRRNGIRGVVEDLKRSCEELEKSMESLEGAMKKLYKQLICVKMALLGILSQA